MNPLCQLLVFGCVLGMCLVSAAAEPKHVVVFQEDGRFAAWPANGGMWIWGDEILVCFTEAAHKDVSGHTYDRPTARNMFARSLDGGETWSVEDAYEAGITGRAMDHHLGERAERPKERTEPIDFTHPMAGIGKKAQRTPSASSMVSASRSARSDRGRTAPWWKSDQKPLENEL